MANPLSLESLLGNAVGTGAGVAAGGAVAGVLAPLLQALTNETWSLYPDAPLQVMLMAEAAVQGKIHAQDASNEARLTGISESRFQSLMAAVANAPSIAAAFTLIRRGQLDKTDLPTILKRAGLEAEWITAYEALSSTGLQPYEQPLSPADLALGLIRDNLQSFDVDGEPAFPAGGSTDGGLVPHDPISGLDVVAEAAASGIDAERMAILARNVGLPPGVIEGLRMLNRGIIEEPDFYLLIAQSDARLSWGPFLFQLRNEILTAREGVENFLRGWDLDRQHMYDTGALSGYSQSQMDTLYNITGRPLGWHQVWVAIQRGGTYDGPTDEIDPSFLKSLQESSMRPEWYNLAWSLRYTYPSYFVLKNLVPTPLSVDQAAQILVWQGWEPTLAQDTAQSFAGSSSSTGAPTTKTATNAAVTSTGKAYIAGSYTQEQATTNLQALGLTAEEIASLFAIWNVTKAAENPQAGPVVAPPGGG